MSVGHDDGSTATRRTSASGTNGKRDATEVRAPAAAADHDVGPRLAGQRELLLRLEPDDGLVQQHVVEHRPERVGFAAAMRILVTGAAGFIGSHAVNVMRAAGHEVQGLDSLAPAVHAGRPDYLPDNFDLAVGDVRDPDAVRRAVAGADVVCHQAALVGLGVDLADLPAYSDVNVTGTAVLLEAMGRSGVPRLVLASSMVVYGEGAYDCAGHGRVRPAPRDVERSGGGLLRAPLPAVLSAARPWPPSPRMPRWIPATPTRPASWPRSIWPPPGPG